MIIADWMLCQLASIDINVWIITGSYGNTKNKKKIYIVFSSYVLIMFFIG